MNNNDIGSPTNSFKTEVCYRDSPSSGVSFENGGGFLIVGKFMVQRSKAGLDCLVQFKVSW